jgi:hypothetical protein
MILKKSWTIGYLILIFCFLFNSYYNRLAKEHYDHRGDLEQPTVKRIFNFEYVDEKMVSCCVNPQI